ncbi:MAG: polysaccharide deacetylase family protein [Clostridiales bacterium]|nr:polysaccharide deacetylase family protein [Clostridiales bacterium]
MRKCLSFIFSILFIISSGATAAGSEKTSNINKKNEPIDDFFADYAIVAPPEPVNLPIIMYHQISENRGRLDTYIISPEEFEEDLKLFKDNGFTTITVSDLLRFVMKKKNLPEKPIMLTFDDGFESDYVYAFPLLKKYEMKAIFSIIGRFTDMFSEEGVVKHINYSHLSWDEIQEMYESGLADFHNHTYDMHVMGKRRGALPRKYESDEDYQKIISDDLGKLNEEYKEHLGISPEAFACPFGCYNDRLKEAVRKTGLSVILSSSQKMNTLTGDPEELLKLNRFLREHNKSMEKLVRSWDKYYNAGKEKKS